MRCEAEGCNLEAVYKAACLCQKHYFRFRRNGDLNIHRKKAKYRIEDERGYQFIHAPRHPLCRKGQIYVAEHRIVLHEAIGPGPMKCEICGVDMTWDTCQADHIDENPKNNDRSNLRPLCRRCNVWRNMPAAAVRMKNAIVLTFEGESKTASEWARDPRVSVSGATIIRRKRDGMTDEQALFSRKITHNGAIKKDNRPRKTRFKYERKNAIAITIDGVTKTAAEWSREPGVTVGVSGLVWRIKNGWDTKRAVFQAGRFS